MSRNRGAVERLANVESMTFVENSLSKLSGARSTARFDVHVVYEKKIDVGAECERLKKELEQIEKEIGNGQRQLSNEQFLAKAPAKVVEGMRARAQELSVLREKAQSKLDELRLKHNRRALLGRAGEDTRPTWIESQTMDWNGRRISAIVENALLEDRATSDATSYACIDPSLRASGTIVAKQDCILAGSGLRAADSRCVRRARWSRNLALRGHQPP